jgi:hypothetical protein
VCGDGGWRRRNLDNYFLGAVAGRQTTWDKKPAELQISLSISGRLEMMTGTVSMPLVRRSAAGGFFEAFYASCSGKLILEQDLILRTN